MNQPHPTEGGITRDKKVVYDCRFVERVLALYPEEHLLNEMLRDNKLRALVHLRTVFQTRERIIEGVQMALGSDRFASLLPAAVHHRWQAEVAMMATTQKEARHYFQQAAKQFGYLLGIPDENALTRVS